MCETTEEYVTFGVYGDGHAPSRLTNYRSYTVNIVSVLVLTIGVTLTENPVLSGLSRYVFKIDSRLMQIKIIAECSGGAFCNTFDLY